jgi:hypothetical protein
VTGVQLDLRATIDADAVRELLRAEVERALQERVAEPEPWLDVRQAARYLGYGDDLERGRRRIYSLVETGRLQVKRDGTRLLFRREWLDAVLDD